MSRGKRVSATAHAELRSFLRRRTAVFFTFLFPAILIVIFGALVQTDPGSGGLFAEPPEYYVAGYLAVVVLFTPLSRVSSTVARYREGNRFEKLATTPLTTAEWLAAQVIVNAAIVLLASVLIVALVIALTGAAVTLSPLVIPAIVLGVVVFCGIGAVLGRITDSRDGAVAASNTVGLPLLFLSDTFVPPSMLPGWFEPAILASPLTYFARSARTALDGGGIDTAFVLLAALAVVAFVAGAIAIPETE